MRVIHLKPLWPDCDDWQGRPLDSSHYTECIRDEVTALKDNGGVLFKVLRRRLPFDLCNRAFPTLCTARQDAANRDLASGNAKLRSGGVFDFDAVSDDRSIVATISTSGSKTSGGKHAVGKILKLRSDMLFLTMVEAKRRIIILTEQDMCNQCEKEFAGGRVPPEIEFICAVIPSELRTRLIAARLKASEEHGVPR